MGMGMMGRMMMDSGTMRGRGMMGDMMNNMEKVDRKIEFSSNGERIFYTGINSRGKAIKNSHGMQGVGCAMCHGADSQGIRMMMMDIPPLTWGYLTDPDGHTHPGGRRHPPYTEPSFNVCVLAGIDPAGNALNAMMPRWEMESGDLADLTEYLKTENSVEEHEQ
jgi:cytochrome c oxidase subunit 2